MGENAGMSSLPALRLPRKKGRAVFQIVGSACFVIAGIVLLIMGLTSQSTGLRSLELTVIGVVTILVFGFFGFLGARMLTRPALVVDDRGIWDNTSGLSVGLIPWEQTLGFQPVRVTLNDLVAVLWADEQWAWDHMKPTARRMNRLNHGTGTPVGPISGDMLKVTGPQLALMLLEQRRQRRPELSEAPGMPPTA